MVVMRKRGAKRYLLIPLAKKKPAAEPRALFRSEPGPACDQFLMAMHEMSERFSVRHAASAES